MTSALPISAVSMHGFKCFDHLRLEFGNLTLLTGFNGGGKSTALQPILLATQTLRTGKSNGLVLNGALARLGTAGDIAPNTQDTQTSLEVEGTGGVIKYCPVLKSGDRVLREDEPLATCDIENYHDADALLTAGLEAEEPASSWEETIESARRHFPNLVLPDAIYQDARLASEPFDSVIRDQFYRLLQLLDDYMDDRDQNGVAGTRAMEIYSEHFEGERPYFVPESPTNQAKFKKELTFPNPSGGADIFAHYHGRISRRTYRFHFEWPVPADERKLKILYLGPKLTK